MAEVNLPKGWVSAELETISTVVTGKTPSKKNPEFFNGSIPFIKPGDIHDQGEIQNVDEYLTRQGADTVPTVPAGSIVVTCIGNLGRCGITTVLSATNQQINTVVPCEQINTFFLYYQLRTLKQWLLLESSATTVTIINKSKFSRAPILLPPLAEQKVIADKLDTLLAQVDNTKARLERIPDILKRFRQSVLAAAVSGKLTEEWRGNPALKFNQPSITIGPEFDSAPQSWEWKKLVDLAQLESGHTPRKSIEEYWNDGDVYWISLQDIREADGQIIQDTKFKPTSLGIENSSARLLPAGTVCYCRDISVGYVTIMGKSMATTQHFANWICGTELNNKFLMYSFMAAKDHLLISGQGTTVKTIYMPALKELRILVPPVNEQSEIVRRVEDLFAFADRIEHAAQAALRRVNNLTQSILAKAFRGELTADWRAAHPELISGENSAEALLARIKAERAKVKSRKKA